ncbi:MAG: hypothetical protein Q8Q12_05555 [bacterium]|nr:hypothetical protein [bacterium]
MEKKLASLEHALRTHSREFYKRAGLEEAEKQRGEFLKRFPLEEWGTMSLEEFAGPEHGSKDTFCLWVGTYSKTGACGRIGRGPRGTQLIQKVSESYRNEQEAWKEVRAGFLEAFQKAEAGQWDDIDEILSINPAHAFRMKVLYLYFPDEVIPICSRGDLRRFLGVLEPRRAGRGKWGVVRLNRELLRSLREIPKLMDWKPKELEPFLYFWLRYRPVVKISTEEMPCSWDVCKQNGCVCVGWGGIGNPRELGSEEECRALLEKLYGEQLEHNSVAITRKASEFWTVVNLQPGDVIVATQGTSTILGVGKVTEPGYEWKPDAPESPHVVRVCWDTSYAQEIEFPDEWVSFAVAYVTRALYKQILKRKG